MRLIRKLSWVFALMCLGLACLSAYLFWAELASAGPTLLERRECAKTRPYPGTEAPFVYWNWDTFYAPEDDSTWWALGYRNWYSTFLCAMGEPPLDSSASDEVMRFLYLRSFDPGLAVRVEKTGSQVKLTAVELEGSPTLEPGFVAHRVTRKLSLEEWEGLQEVLEAADFWKLPTNKRNPGAMDGAQWIVEVLKEGKQHVVDRWGGDEIEAVGLCLLELSGLEPGDIY